MLNSPPNLDEYRSVEELQRLGNDVRDEMRGSTPAEQPAELEQLVERIAPSHQRW